MMFKPIRSRKRPLLALAAALAFAGAAQADEWAAYGRDPGGTRFSPLKQIDRTNVAGLKVAWTFNTGDISTGKTGGPRSGFQTTPLYLDGRLYLTTPFGRVIALDPATGRQVWAHDPKVERAWPYGDGLINRGLASWRDGAGQGACAVRLYEATIDARLIALDAATGKPCADFGQDGEVSLRNVKNYRDGWYHMTSPPAVVGDVVVVGSAIDDNSRVDMPDGVVRGFDARTGKLVWSWQPLEKPPGVTDAAWQTGAANAWSIMTVDPARGLVFVPTGSASPDYYGGLRPGDNRWANSVVALDGRTGKLAWGFQLVHHDLWDYDSASAPLLADVPTPQGRKPAVIAGNKTGFLYVLDRDTGRPLWPVEERPVPQSDIPGELTSPTQPFPTTLPALVPQSIGPDQAWGLNDADRAACRAKISELKGGSVFTPPGLAPRIAVPGNVGGMNWSGYALDTTRDLLVVSVTHLPFIFKLIPTGDIDAAQTKGDFRAEYARQRGAPYGMARAPFMGASGLPCVASPWGSLVGVDLKAGKIAWSTPLGSLDELAPAISKVAPGSIALGGPIVTAGGLVFTAGTIDRRLHGFDVETGKEIWTADLPASAHAMPMTYEARGKQYLVIAAGGAAKIDEEKQSDAVIAYALPDN
jgi:membrane-bound PQQ-dependent dehydrogenase (glucose/quinate/shikimate family)